MHLQSVAQHVRLVGSVSGQALLEGELEVLVQLGSVVGVGALVDDLNSTLLG